MGTDPYQGRVVPDPDQRRVDTCRPSKLVLILEQEAQQQRKAVESAQESLQLFTNRYRGGVDNYLQVITAQTVALTNQRNEIDILRRRIGASVLLVKALGGGWSVAELPPPQ